VHRLAALLVALVPWLAHAQAPASLASIADRFVMAIWCAGLFGLTALFTLTSYPVQYFFQRRGARGPG
jgi:hypothetical protein